MKNIAVLLILLPIGCTSTVVAPPAVEVDSADEERLDVHEKLLEIHNDNRTSPLTSNRELTKAAQRHADWMAANRRMSHSGVGSSSPASRIRVAGYDWSTYGENVARGQTTPEDVMRTWLNSHSHRQNIKRDVFRDVGFGHATSSTGQIYWCVTFGSRGFSAAEEWNESWAAPDFEEPCSGCKGTGKTGTDVCQYCGGDKVLSVEVATEEPL